MVDCDGGGGGAGKCPGLSLTGVGLVDRGGGGGAADWPGTLLFLLTGVRLLAGPAAARTAPSHNIQQVLSLVSHTLQNKPSAVQQHFTLLYVEITVPTARCLSMMRSRSIPSR